MTRWYVRDWFEYEAVKNNNAYSQDIHDGLEEAVKRQLMSDVPYGVLLSGGLDSSVISAIAKKYAGKRVETDNKKGCLVASAPFLCHRSGRCARPDKGPRSGPLYRNRAS